MALFDYAKTGLLQLSLSLLAFASGLAVLFPRHLTFALLQLRRRAASGPANRLRHVIISTILVNQCRCTAATGMTTGMQATHE